MPHLFTPPTHEVAVESRHPFWRRDTDTVGRTVLKLADKQYVTVDDPSNEQIAASVLPYLGGRTYYISDLEADDLIAAGYGAYIQTSGGAYGSGVYGAGLYGSGGDTGDGINVSGGTYDGRG
jgi:hypothetical protein